MVLASFSREAGKKIVAVLRVVRGPVIVGGMIDGSRRADQGSVEIDRIKSSILPSIRTSVLSVGTVETVKVLRYQA